MSDLLDNDAIESATSNADIDLQRVLEAELDRQMSGEATPRDEYGRFAEKTEAAPAKEAAATTEAQPQADAATDPAAPAQPTGVELPASWGAKRAELWTKTPPDVQSYIVERERQMSEGVRRFEGLAEYADLAERSGTNLREAFSRYIAAEQSLDRDPVGTILELAAMYGVKDQIAAAASGQQPSQAVAPQPAPFEPVMRRLDAIEQRFHQQRVSETEGQVRSFASDPANKHFDAVADDMIMMIRGAQSSGKAVTPADLKDYYDRACYANPDVRAILTNEARAADEAKRADEARKAATAAKRASQSLSGSASGSQARPGKTTIDDALSAKYDEMTGNL
jgi:hypothetical protein